MFISFMYLLSDLIHIPNLYFKAINFPAAAIYSFLNHSFPQKLAIELQPEMQRIFENVHCMAGISK